MPRPCLPASCLTITRQQAAALLLYFCFVGAARQALIEIYIIGLPRGRCPLKPPHILGRLQITLEGFRRAHLRGVGRPLGRTRRPPNRTNVGARGGPATAQPSRGLDGRKLLKVQGSVELQASQRMVQGAAPHGYMRGVRGGSPSWVGLY